MTTEAPLDFVFLDSNSEPCRVRLFGGQYWIFYRHPDRKWVTLRQVSSQSELWHMEQAAIGWECHKAYEYGVPFTEQGWPQNQRRD